MKTKLALAIVCIPLLAGCLQHTQDELIPVEGYCTVVRSDKQTGFVTDRYEFNDVGLVRHHARSSPDSFTIRENRYEGSLVVSGTVRGFNKGGEDEPYLSWQRPMVTYSTDVTREVELQFEHDDGGRLVRWASESKTQSELELMTIKQTRLISYDDVGRKIRSEETAWASNRADYTHRTIRTYSYRDDDQVDQVLTEKLDSYTTVVNFFYDEVGRVVGFRSGAGGVMLPFQYDERGRLLGWGGNSAYTWDDDDHIIERNVGERIRYTYQRGRLHEATFEDGSGYVQDYSAECPTGFNHPLITPNTLYHTEYEGPEMHYTWSAF